MTTLNELPFAPTEVNESETIYVSSPSAGNCQSTVGRLFQYFKNKVLSQPAVAALPWGADTTTPSIGNGKIAADIITVGLCRTVTLSVSMESGTTYGSGAWVFALPAGFTEPASSGAIGIARAIIGGQMVIGVAEIAAGKAEIKVSSPAGMWGKTIPGAWAAGDKLDTAVTYRIG